MYLKSTLFPFLRTGCSIYFWAILGPVYILLIINGKLSVIIISIDLAKFGGLSIHKLF